MNTDRYIYFIYQELRGDLSLAESKELQDWLNLSPDNRKVKEDIVQSLSVVDQLNPSFPIDLETDYLRIKNNLGLNNSLETKPSNPGRPRRIFIYFLVVAFGVSLLYYLINSQSVAPIEMFAENTGAGEKKELLLDDGTIVHLNEHSTIEYPSLFQEDSRIVKLTGEAYFDVAKAESKPFIIATSHAEIEVLGTAFNVNATENKSFVSVTVDRGKVQLSNLDHTESLILTAREAGTLNKKKQTVQQIYVDYLDFPGWKSHQFSFKNAKLKDVFERLENDFSIKINFDSKISDCRYSMTKQEVNLDELLESLASLYKFEIEKLSETVYFLKGGNCN